MPSRNADPTSPSSMSACRPPKPTKACAPRSRSRRNHPDPAVLVFSQWVETVYARQILSEPGKIGYLLKDRIVTTEQFIDAVHRVADGGTALDPEVVRQLLARPPSTKDSHALPSENATSLPASPRVAQTRRSPTSYSWRSAAWRST